MRSPYAYSDSSPTLKMTSRSYSASTSRSASSASGTSSATTNCAMLMNRSSFIALVLKRRREPDVGLTNDLFQRRMATFAEQLAQLFHNPNRRARIREVGGPDPDGARAGEKKFERVGDRFDAALADDGDFHGARGFVDREHRDGANRGTRQTARDVAQTRLPCVDVDRHAPQRVDHRERIGAGVLGLLGDDGDVTHVGREFHD